MSDGNEMTECPVAKRPKLDEANGQNNEEEDLKEKLKEFHVLDEVEGDDGGSDDGGSYHFFS